MKQGKIRPHLISVVARENSGRQMRAIIPVSVIVTLAIAGAALARAPLQSIRPLPRQLNADQATRTAPVQVFYRPSVRPRPRTVSGYGSVVFGPVDEPADPRTYALATTVPVYRSPHPPRRPTGLKRGTVAATSTRVASATPTLVSVGRTGVLCGDRRIQGEVLAPIKGGLPGCGLDAPVRVASVDGVVLGQSSVMDCHTAKTLRKWVTNTLKPAVHKRGGGVKSLSVPSHYSCRTRSSQPGAKISEHGKGRAIDISAINFNNGTKLTVLNGWKNRTDKKLLSALHSGACGPFGTVLGPDSDRHHQDHFHFDTARHRSGSYCR